MRHEVEYVRPDSLRPAPYNPRRISSAALKRLARLLDEYGFVDPVIARREDRLIIAGHQRIKANALRARPDERVPVIFLDGVSDEKAKALNIALNNPAAGGEYDLPKLGEVLLELGVDDLDLPAATGFSEDEIANLVAATERTSPTPEDIELPECFQVVVECESELRQREVYERLRSEGFRCRLLML